MIDFLSFDKTMLSGTIPPAMGKLERLKVPSRTLLRALKCQSTPPSMYYPPDVLHIFST